MIKSSNCEFCRNEFSNTTIKEYNYWKLQLFLNQYYLGRCLLKLDRHIIDLCDLREEERQELFEKILPEVKKALDNLFEPDLYNYSSLGNDCRHLHLHLIPRYSSKREFQGTEFKDENWNSHYMSYPENFEISETKFRKLKNKIGDQL